MRSITPLTLFFGDIHTNALPPSHHRFLHTAPPHWRPEAWQAQQQPSFVWTFGNLCFCCRDFCSLPGRRRELSRIPKSARPEPARRPCVPPRDETVRCAQPPGRIAERAHPRASERSPVKFGARCAHSCTLPCRPRDFVAFRAEASEMRWSCVRV